jgi:hypothetical protein
MPTVTDYAIWQVTGLRHLALTGNSSITDAGLLALVNLTSLSIDCPFGDENAGVAIKSTSIARLTGLTSLELIANCSCIKSEALTGLCRLTNLSLRGNWEITDEAISGLFNLRNLEIGRVITDTALFCLPNLTSLEFKRVPHQPKYLIIDESEST